MVLTHTDKRGLRKSDFGVAVADDSVEIPTTLKDALDRLAVRTPEQFVSYLQAFPSAVAGELGWSIPDVLRARAAVVRKLRGHLPDILLNPPPMPVRGTGAMDPNIAAHRRPRR